MGSGPKKKSTSTSELDSQQPAPATSQTLFPVIARMAGLSMPEKDKSEWLCPPFNDIDGRAPPNPLAKRRAKRLAHLHIWLGIFPGLRVEEGRWKTSGSLRCCVGPVNREQWASIRVVVVRCRPLLGCKIIERYEHHWYVRYGPLGTTTVVSL